MDQELLCIHRANDGGLAGSRRTVQHMHPNPIWNNGALGFSEERRPNKKHKNKKNNKMSSDMGTVPDP